MKLKKGDQVIVLAGKDKGNKGKIEKTLPQFAKVLVAGVNLYKKHVKPQGEKKPGGIIDIIKPLSVSNVALICPKCGQKTKIGYQIKQGEKKRICKKCQAIL
ncbi:50S ribosomal protein L24 [Candidatus Shapirobacteria bacterium CG10_big_fil_rev_8_21_14_0_10_38_14]|uniref:Large ribosomal subunit protein uL24 n=1 Tax=Candidatus Shapirobacteria bacterium CG10_big_fil_rev_8_21_14_0_10_38_14 TaxID=1974483 RepID=A0A2M8L5S2_9BACT|nr:MAG: 50S ribosomal protein L24 [Candidatus Shapirobacteria bacterium CG10_big_fil_rev_8_21_14_0_10_38_14]